MGKRQIKIKGTPKDFNQALAWCLHVNVTIDPDGGQENKTVLLYVAKDDSGKEVHERVEETTLLLAAQKMVKKIGLNPKIGIIQ